MALTALKVKRAGPGRHADEKGLYLLVRPSGSRSWVLRVQFDGKRRDYGLGGHLSLAEARDRANRWRKWAKDGRDPRIEWERLNETVPTFEAVAREAFEIFRKKWRAGKHQNQWMTMLEHHAFPKLGKRQVDEIRPRDIAAAMEPIWETKPEAARRVLSRIGRILDYACSKDWRDEQAPMRATRTLLGDQGKETRSFPAVPYEEIPMLWNAMRGANDTRQSVGRFALMFELLTAARPGEVRWMPFRELDFASARWVIPKARYKTNKLHMVPLSSPAIALIRSLPWFDRLGPDDLVFPGTKRGQPISDATMKSAMRRAGFGEYTPHGTSRSGFRDWAAEVAKARHEVGEAALGHLPGDDVVSAYLRATYFDERRELMDRWADYVTGVQSNVVSIVKAGA
ncbi:site-specific integrase [uncultured Parasphingopyxis sp.]|uniref:tyrosine-type recombinase/integrase n=1 Tax=uncultured Parasphingopyxis sp. TaxID=1547918 RepID=UPI002634F123|nr:site-specific integrase [uncultured Parasphingopyxis sp.]